MTATTTPYANAVPQGRTRTRSESEEAKLADPAPRRGRVRFLRRRPRKRPDSSPRSARQLCPSTLGGSRKAPGVGGVDAAVPSIVAATVRAVGTARASSTDGHRAAAVEGPGRLGLAAGRDHPRLVRLALRAPAAAARRRARPRPSGRLRAGHSAACEARSSVRAGSASTRQARSSCARSPAERMSRATQPRRRAPSGEARRAATAVTRPGAQRGRSGTTFSRSARRREDPVAQAGRRRGRRRPPRRAPWSRSQSGELLAAARAAGEVRLVRRAPRPRRARERVGGGQVVDRPCRLLGRVAEQLAQAREAGEHPALDRTDRLAEPLRELRLREAAVVRELERLPLLVGQLLQRGLDALALKPQPGVLVGAAAAPARGAASSGSVRRRCSRRTRSTARRCTSVRIHVLALPRSGTKRGAVRQTRMNASCTASSASASSRSTRSARP